MTDCSQVKNGIMAMYQKMTGGIFHECMFMAWKKSNDATVS